ncbi:zinc finger, C3HC4 type (RING finger) domain protein [Toxoplasma gondii RUB]|nr:zinc finger, C3HC4 type (RING finger) domain-containing protein [Toxoplasma gondii FOU]KFG62126.1 zinc finger, C3HC4 type (RING finger) domain protein [Toxoplasma gondii RUB]KFH08020.1 zinc finger, C3HC4 type (RING finger) domain-containing protein [Toxoplasma gondii VAND]PUA86314.1 zinc finger, C3HC4 type (RING finger) domain-containing protein [Toxoplasma gondii TgCATBr9]
MLRLLEEIRDKEYHPTKWSSWDFVDNLLVRCAPQEASALLLLPIAESQ